MDYEEQLDRAMEHTPDYNSADERFELPYISTRQSGNKTILSNVRQISDTFNREPDHVITFLQNELGTGVSRENNRALFTGSFSEDRITRHIEEYADVYVLCSQCGLPDTRLESQSGEEVLRCTACGAHSTT